MNFKEKIDFFRNLSESERRAFLIIKKVFPNSALVAFGLEASKRIPGELVVSATPPLSRIYFRRLCAQPDDS
jgi:hypothetical protein